LNKWLLLIYKIPRKPSALRVGVWRKLKQLGAILLHDAVWVLPFNARTEEQFQWLAAEIVELGGEATVGVAQLSADSSIELTDQFTQQTDDAYKQLLAALKRNDADPNAISRRYQQVLAQDYFRTKVGEKVRAALLKRRQE
jgi:DNA-binding transcriptional regulator PaaX